ncbi:hypothetical protein SISNIDRAFT_396923, partial [Sistotremastrum niveocremeum HHB9708]
DFALLDLLTSGPLPNVALPPKTRHVRRDAPLDPLLFAATAASGPHVTRHHYHHGFQPDDDDNFWAWASDQPQPTATPVKSIPPEKPQYVSKQAPRRQRLAKEDAKENQSGTLSPLRSSKNLPPPATRKTRSSSISTIASTAPPVTLPPPPPKPLLEVTCMARTRVPTPHGPVFLHIYRNNQDNKEHLAIVVDPAQLSDDVPIRASPIRSQSLDAVWSSDESELDRLIRGAYLGRLSPEIHTPSTPPPKNQNQTISTTSSQNQNRPDIPLPLVRIHSECFTGETIGSLRCDCGEQLDEALRLISQPLTVPLHDGSNSVATIPGRGAVIYMRQEGRGIGLLSKIRAYNLQDMGHDTVTANLLLGHKADERGYEIACAILQDLGLGGGGGAGGERREGIRLLTNNPDKVHALEENGVQISERVPMVPRSWTCRQHDASASASASGAEEHSSDATRASVRSAGATLIGAGATESPELEKYLHTKVTRMGHMLTLPS